MKSGTTEGKGGLLRSLSAHVGRQGETGERRWEETGTGGLDDGPSSGHGRVKVSGSDGGSEWSSRDVVGREDIPFTR